MCQASGFADEMADDNYNATVLAPTDVAFESMMAFLRVSLPDLLGARSLLVSVGVHL